MYYYFAVANWSSFTAAAKLTMLPLEEGGGVETETEVIKSDSGTLMQVVGTLMQDPSRCEN